MEILGILIAGAIAFLAYRAIVRKPAVIVTPDGGITVYANNRLAIVREWNERNALKESLNASEQQDFIKMVREQVTLRNQMETIEAACVAEHLFSAESRAIHSSSDVADLGLARVSNMRESLRSCDDTALVVLKARLVKLIAPNWRQLSDRIMTRAIAHVVGLSRDGRSEEQVFSKAKEILERHIIPFLATFYEIKITQALGTPFNIYVAANLRELFVTPLQMSVKQNFGVELARSDAEIMIENYHQGYREHVSALLNGDHSLLKDRIFGRGIYISDVISEEFCTYITESFLEFSIAHNSSIYLLLSDEGF